MRNLTPTSRLKRTLLGVLLLSAFGLGVAAVGSTANPLVASSQVDAQYLNNLSIVISGGNLNATLPFNTSTLQNNDSSTAAGVRIDFTITKPDASTVAFAQTTDSNGRIRGQIYSTVVNQLGTYNINAVVFGGSPTAAGTFTIVEFAQLDRDSQVFTGNQQVFKNDANSTTAFAVQNAAGAAVLNIDTTNSEVEVTNLVASGTITGNGSGLTSLNGSNISSGTVADARLSGNVTVQGNSFNGVSQLVQTTVAGALPALSGANLTSLNGSNIASGTVNDARLSTNVTVQGNTFNGVSQLVQTTGAGALPALSGANLTSLNASNLASGAVPDARLSANVTVQGNSFNGLSQLVQTTGAGALPAISGVNVTNLNATNIASGTVADARLSANVALLDRNSQTFTGSNEIFKNSADSTTAFQVQKASGTTLLGIDTTGGKIFSTVADGASAVAFTLNSPSYTTAGAKLIKLENNGLEKFSIDKDGLITTASVQPDSLTSGLADTLGVSTTGTSRRGKSIINTEQSTNSATYTTLSTPDQVTVNMPTDGLIYILYRALWKTSSSADGCVAIFIDGNQMTSPASDGAPGVQERCGSVGSFFSPLWTINNGNFGLSTSNSADSTDVTTGESVTGASDQGPITAIFASAGSHTVSVQYKTEFGSTVTVKNRKLWVWPQGF